MTTISTSLKTLQTEWEGDDIYFSKKLLNEILDTYPSDFYTIDEINQCFNHINFGIVNAEARLKQAYEILVAPKNAPATSTPPATDEQVIKTKEPYSDAQKQEYVRAILSPLGGVNPQKHPIMSEADFNRLIAYTDHLVLSNTLPDTITSIKQTEISNLHISYTFYRLHKQLFGTRRIKDSFIEFLHTTFSQFAGTSKTTTKAKFATAPNSYENDFAGYISEVA